jgi:hypothetical protein
MLLSWQATTLPPGRVRPSLDNEQDEVDNQYIKGSREVERLLDELSGALDYRTRIGNVII